MSPKKLRSVIAEPTFSVKKDAAAYQHLLIKKRPRCKGNEQKIRGDHGVTNRGTWKGSNSERIFIPNNSNRDGLSRRGRSRVKDCRV